MTRAATAGELAKLRSDGQWARWKVIIDRPDVLYTARATGAVSETDWSIAFDGGSGTLGDCLPDMTLLIGSTSGGWERGIARLRKAPAAGVFYIGADPSIVCQDNDYLTVLNDFSPFARHPMGEAIDVDVTLSDQFTDFIPVAVIDTLVQVVEAGDTASFNGANSWVPESTITGFSWTFPGATATSGTTTATPTATYGASGRFRVALTVTANNGKTNTTYGWVYALGSSLSPETGIVLSDDPRGGSGVGWTCQVYAYDRPTIKDRARAVIYAEDYFGNIKGSIGPVSGCENQIMVGWIIGETIIRQPGQDVVEFVIGGPGAICAAIATLPAGLVDTAYPEDNAADLPAWSKMSDLTIIKGLHYLINYRSTLARCMPVETEDWTTPAHNLAANTDNLWGQITEFAKQGIMTATPDRYAHVFIERAARLYPLADRAADIPVVMDVNDSDWTDETAISRRQISETSIAEAEGTLFIAGSVIPIGGRSPGDIPAAFGAGESLTGLSFATAAESLEIAGLMAGALNAEYGAVTGSLAANNHFIDVAPRQYFSVTVDGDTINTIPRSLSMRRDNESGRVWLEVEGEPAGGQWSATEIEYPGEGTEPADPGEETPEPPTPPENPPTEEPVGDGDAVGVTTTEVRSTADLSAGSPTWTAEGTHPSAPVDSDLTGSTLWVLEEDTVWKTDDIGGGDAVWEEMTTAAIYNAATGNTNTKFLRIRARSVVIYVMLMTQYPDQVGTDQYWLVCLRSINNGQTWSSNGIIDFAHSLPPWYFDQDPGNITFGVNRGSGSYEFIDDYTLHITGSFDGTTGNHHVYGTFPILGDWADGYPETVRLQIYGDLPSTMPDDATVADAHEIQYKTITSVNGTPEGDDVYYYSGLNSGPTVQNLRITDASVYGNNSDSFDYYVRIIEVDGVEVASGPPTAFDVAPSNINYVYASVGAKIYASINHGWLWSEFYDLHGANDICVDPQLAGAIYYASTEGDINLMVRQPDGTGAINATLDTESEVETPLRIARDLNSGRLWVLNGGGTLKCRYNGSWSEQKTGLSGATGLHAYVGGKLIFVDGSDIYISDDYGATVTAKKGGWSGFASGVNGHRFGT